MAFFKKRSPRINLEVPVKIFFMQPNSRELSQQYLPGFLINLSVIGASITVSKVMLEGNHIFFTTQTQKLIYLSFDDNIGEDDLHFDIDGFSIWMDACTFRGQNAFKIGIEFLGKQKELYNLLKRMKK